MESEMEGVAAGGPAWALAGVPGGAGATA